MVGLVIVSHSAKLAEGVAELARGMAGPEMLLRATGGLDLPDRPLGTDVGLVLQAIEEVYSDDGVLVLMDLGSAVLSAEMALEGLPPERRARIKLCEAPLVEGAIAAAVQARLGASLEQVLSEARGALEAKRVHLSTEMELSAPTAAHLSSANGKVYELRLKVGNALGLHARPAARFVQTFGQFPQADAHVTNLSTVRGPVSARSINAVTTLGVRQGHEILLTASGAQAEAALAALKALADDNFGDVDLPTSAKSVPPTKSKKTNQAADDQSVWQGLAVSPGIAIGPARIFRPTLPDLPTHRSTQPQAEWDTLTAAIARARTQIAGTRDAVLRRADQYTAAIFEAHLLILDDEAVCAPVHERIFRDKQNAALAWHTAIEETAASYRALDDEYLRARAADVEDVGRQVLLNLLDTSSDAPLFTEPGILVAADLTPADTAQLNTQLVLGICTAAGGPTSHSAILARSLGIPAVAGMGERVLSLAEDTPLIMDGETGQVWPNPQTAILKDYQQRAVAYRAAQAAAKAASASVAVTGDGRRIEIVANVGSVADARAAVESGAEGVGLFRTEFLFLDRRTAPGEDEQVAAYRAVAAVMGNRPVIIRTLDAGGDKPLPYLDMGVEANPFLGWRAIRLCLAQPELFKTQLRAIVRVAAEFPTKIMFPMIATLAEWRAARALLEEARLEVLKRGLPVPDRVETGIMVEIPSAAVRAAQFAAEVDFFSIGTNDLTQYTLAAERGNPRVANLSDAFEPAVLELIRQTVNAAHAHGKWVGICGELAGDPVAVPLLVGLGIDELSMSAPAIPRVKQIVRTLDYSLTQTYTQAALLLENATMIRAAAKATPRA